MQFDRQLLLKETFRKLCESFMDELDVFLLICCFSGFFLFCLCFCFFILYHQGWVSKVTIPVPIPILHSIPIVWMEALRISQTFEHFGSLLARWTENLAKRTALDFTTSDLGTKRIECRYRLTGEIQILLGTGYFGQHLSSIEYRYPNCHCNFTTYKHQIQLRSALLYHAAVRIKPTHNCDRQQQVVSNSV